MRKILLYDSLFFYGKGLQSILKSNFSELDVVMVFGPNIALEECNKHFYDIIIFDLFYDNRYNFQTLKKIKSCQPNSKLFLLCTNNSEDFKLQCFKIGVDFLLMRDCSEAYFVAAVKLALYGGSYFTKKLRLNVSPLQCNTNNRAVKNPIESLSSREYEIALMMINGVSNIKIGDKLNLASTTISTYKRRILEKTKTSNIIEVSKLFEEV